MNAAKTEKKIERNTLSTTKKAFKKKKKNITQAKTNPPI